MQKLLLRVDVPSLGRIGDVVEVADGYARNYLLPRGLALEPTDGNLKKIEEAKKEYEAIRAKETEEKRALAARLDGLELTLLARSNEQGHLFGSVGPKEIADALSDEGYNIDEGQIDLAEHIKQIDKHTVPVRFDEDISCELIVWVAPEKSDDGVEGTDDDDDGE